jgi:hypothetical protein
MILTVKEKLSGCLLVVKEQTIMWIIKGSSMLLIGIEQSIFE